ncbi:MAG: tRNA uridine-5-carboxymethylaminomethyl(34) synthesis GTPase MnmE [Rhodospirillaceae bacterium]|nr:tRNA uridine-5-carboxymethylaminomethyl(34) synthesis GTPase MnmE [Rhodospirillaceae bacterium]
MNYQADDTIAAIATPSGSGAIAIVRISGDKALEITREIVGIKPRARHAHICSFSDENKNILDQGLVLFFPGPNSFTGEDLAELHCHGGVVISDWLLSTVLSLGARAAEPGEFTLRAFLNNKIDLTQAEAVADLISSGSREAAQAAFRSLNGTFSDGVEKLQKNLTETRAHIEAWLDFPDEDIEPAQVQELGARLKDNIEALERIDSSAREGVQLRDGIDIVIAGPPNVGKSSLMNRLAGYDAAIVAKIPGTTRDPLKEHLSIDGLPVTLTDTAGFRASNDPIELEGVRRGKQAIERANHLLWMVDVRDELSVSLENARKYCDIDTAITILQNKVDLVSQNTKLFDCEDLTVIRLSALTGEGVSILREHIKSLADFGGESSGTFSARSRHINALQRAHENITSASKELLSNRALELAAEDLRTAQSALSELTGEVSSDDLLGEIFSGFCIGK